jgi:hypothetical protein
MNKRKHKPVAAEPHMTFSQRLAMLTKQAHNFSPKPLQRLRASLAFLDKKALLAALPGSAKRGLARGKTI